MHHNLIVRSRNMTGMNVMTFDNHALFDQPSYMTFDSNLVYRFSAEIAGTGGTYPGQALNTYTNNLWDAPTSGSNTNDAAASFPDPLTSADLFARLGCSDKPTCAARMVESPSSAWAARARAILWQGYFRT